MSRSLDEIPRRRLWRWRTEAILLPITGLLGLGLLVVAGDETSARPSLLASGIIAVSVARMLALLTEITAAERKQTKDDGSEHR